MQVQQRPVLIVGGGPVGLTAALMLARYDIPTILIERHPGTSIHPRARGINTRTMEIFRELDLETQIRNAGIAPENTSFALTVETLAGKELSRIALAESVFGSVSRDNLSPTDWCFCSQDALEPLLLAADRAYGVDVRFNTELRTFVQGDQGVTALVHDKTTDQQYPIHTQYMLAADGSSSPVRSRLAIPLHGRGTLGYYMNIYFRADLAALVKDRQFVLCEVTNKLVEGMLLAVNNTDRWLFNMRYHPQPDNTDVSDADFSTQHCIEYIRQAIGLPQLEVEILSTLPWEAAVRVADHYQINRVFLAGDAAHQMPPAGGYGMNTGIQDAQNLCWKLAATLHGQADPQLLATYETERCPVAQLTTAQAGLRMIERPMLKPMSQQRPAALIDDLSLILGYQYSSAAVIPGTDDQVSLDHLNLTGQPGTRAPHYWFKYHGHRISMIDLCGQRFVLLTGTKNQCWATSARRVADSIDLPLDIYRIGPYEDLVDPTEQWATYYGITTDGAILIRPDGFVAWRSINYQLGAEQILAEVFKHLLCRSVRLPA